MPEIIKTVEQIERERVTRRQALSKFGFGAGLSAFMLLGVDDLARMVGTKMEQMAGDNQVAEQIAREFQNAGVAFASPSNPPPSPSTCKGNSNCTGCSADSVAACCGQDAKDSQFLCCAKSSHQEHCCQGLTGVYPWNNDPESYGECMAITYP